MTKAMKIALLILAGGAIVAALTGSQHWWTYGIIIGVCWCLAISEIN